MRSSILCAEKSDLRLDAPRLPREAISEGHSGVPPGAQARLGAPRGDGRLGGGARGARLGAGQAHGSGRTETPAGTPPGPPPRPNDPSWPSCSLRPRGETVAGYINDYTLKARTNFLPTGKGVGSSSAW